MYILNQFASFYKVPAGALIRIILQLHINREITSVSAISRLRIQELNTSSSTYSILLAVWGTLGKEFWASLVILILSYFYVTENHFF